MGGGGVFGVEGVEDLDYRRRKHIPFGETPHSNDEIQLGT